ncbi:MAG: alpha/beta hydrolase [Actinomycetia bacterium]|nr:alpha/beta hydrolase [Actinomycetes bacterium]
MTRQRPRSGGSVAEEDESGEDEQTPLEALGILASQTATIAPGLDHLEAYTMEGLLTVMWHGPSEAERVVAMVGGAMGGLLGAGGLYHEIGVALADMGIGVLRVGYRRPNDLDLCTHDLLAAMELAARHGARRFVTVGHSFGGAVAIRAASRLTDTAAPGVVTLATQSAGCEPAEELVNRRLLFIHGDHDQILPHQSSEMVRFLAGTGELMIIPGGDHLLAGARDEIRERLLAWIPEVLAGD